METGMEASVKGHKGKLKGQFEDELMAAEKKAIAELERKRKESKGSKWFKGLTTLISLVPGWGQIAGAVMGGLGGAFGAKKQAKEAAKMAGRAKKYALDIDPKWQKSFLGGASKEYKAQALFDDFLKKETEPAYLKSIAAYHSDNGITKPEFLNPRVWNELDDKFLIDNGLIQTDAAGVLEDYAWKLGHKINEEKCNIM